MKNKRKIIVTNTLPCASDPLHLGHLVEYIQTDIWVRFQKLRGNTCHYVGADDPYSTPVSLSAQQKNTDPHRLTEKMTIEHKRDFSRFNIQFDHHGSTHSEENEQLINTLYKKATDKGHIKPQTIQQAYDQEANAFLPDRFIQGECPNCSEKDQQGNHCQSCGATYRFTELIKPISTLTGNPLIEKETEHYFFNINDFKPQLHHFLETGVMQKKIAHKLLKGFGEDLKTWDMTRDMPYRGGKHSKTNQTSFYTELKTPVGYLSSFKSLCDKKNIDFNAYWGIDSSAEIYHFVGKDSAHFHTLFWPALLTAGDYRRPTGIFFHSSLTVNGLKMSKSRDTLIQADRFVRHLPPEALRYYFAAKLSHSTDDIDLNLKDFLLRVNSDLIGKVVNIASRCAGFINKRFNNQLAAKVHDEELLDYFINESDLIASLYEKRKYGRAMHEIMTLADIANQYIAEYKPWVLIKSDDNKEIVHQICTQGLNLYRLLIIYLKPVLPELARKSELFFNEVNMNWESIQYPLLNHPIRKFKLLMSRIEQSDIDAMLSENKDIPIKNKINKGKLRLNHHVNKRDRTHAYAVV